MNMDKLKEVFADEAFVEGLLQLESAAEVQEALKEKDIEMTEDDIISLRDIMVKVESGEVSEEQMESWAAQAEEGEIPEEMLELVSGGVITITALVLGALVTTLKMAAVGVGAAGVTVGASYAVRNRW